VADAGNHRILGFAPVYGVPALPAPVEAPPDNPAGESEPAYPAEGGVEPTATAVP
jgi:hypothetical protein